MNFFSLIFPLLYAVTTTAFGGISTRSFTFSPKIYDEKPKLILISGCTGTGKSTFGMSVALDQGILKCISTDTVRAVMRSFIGKDISPSLHRSSYKKSRPDDDDPVQSWLETCTVLSASVEGLVDDAISRGISLVVEGVHIVPSNELIRKWEESGGVAVGCLLTIPDENAHKSLLRRRGDVTGKGEEEKLQSFDRVGVIQNEMSRLAKDSQWITIEQKIGLDPLEMIAVKLGDDIDSQSGECIDDDNSINIDKVLD